MSQKNYIFLILALFAITFSQPIIKAAAKPNKETDIANLRIKIKKIEISVDEKLKIFQEQTEKINQLQEKIKEQCMFFYKEIENLAKAGINQKEFIEKMEAELKIYGEPLLKKTSQKILPPLSINRAEMDISNLENWPKLLLNYSTVRTVAQLFSTYLIEMNRWERCLFELETVSHELTTAQEQLNNLLTQI